MFFFAVPGSRVPHSVPVLLLFYAYGVMDLDTICSMVQRTSQWADIAALRRLLYATQQHTAAVRDRGEAIAVLVRCASNGGPPRPGQPAPSPASVEDLLNANVLPHLPQPRAKLRFLAHLVGILLNHLFLPTARGSQMYDKDHMLPR